MAAIPDSGSAPQFGTAEYAAKPGGDLCRSCRQPITSNYFRVNGAIACSPCSEKVRQMIPRDSHAAYVRGVVFGVGGAVLGLILYSAFGIITGLVIGYISLAVGYIVGKAIMFGSNGIGGRRYQIAAALLTYAAVSMAAIPMGIAQYAKSRPPKPAAQSSTFPDDSTAGETPQSQKKPDLNLGKAFLGLAILGLASPFLELQNPIQGGLGLIILFVGIRIAWQMTAGKSIQILGPFQSSVPPPAPEQAPAG
jgi:hypothetical protein